MNKKLHLSIVGYLLITFLFLFTSLFLLTRKNSSYEQININYEEASNPIDYKVYLKDNNFFESKYLGKGATYISSLIDYVAVDYNYKISFNELLTGNYKYKIKATIQANKATEAGNYWTKDYELLTKEESFTDTSYVSINQHLDLDYQQYNDLLSSFKKEYGLAIDGLLHLEMIIDLDGYIDDNSVIECDNNCNHLKKETVLKMDIPLTQNSVDISINTNESSNSKGTISYERRVSDSNTYIIIQVVAILLLIVCVVLVAVVISFLIKKQKMVSSYHKEVKKILNTYDSIIVNSGGIKDLSKYNVIKVNSFEELLDAHSEVRMPINFVELRSNCCMFILINNDIAWIYRVVGDDYEEE